MVFEHVASFAIKETRYRHIYHFRMGEYTTETRETGPSRIWKRDLACSQQLTLGNNRLGEVIPFRLQPA